MWRSACLRAASSTTGTSTVTAWSPSVTTSTPASTVGGAARPSTSSGKVYRDPISVMFSVATGYLGFAGSVIGTFRQGDARSGEVDLQFKVSGPVTTVEASGRQDGATSPLATGIARVAPTDRWV